MSAPEKHEKGDTHPRRTRVAAELASRGIEVQHANVHATRGHGHGGICCCWMQGCRSDACTLNAAIISDLDGEVPTSPPACTCPPGRVHPLHVHECPARPRHDEPITSPGNQGGA